MTLIFENRLENVKKTMKELELDTFLVSIQENRRYLSGFTGEDSQFDETAGVLIITANRLVLATDSRFTLQAEREAPLFNIRQYEKGLFKELPEYLKELNTRKMGFESRRLPFSQYTEMVKEIKSKDLSVELVPTDNVVEKLRIIKDESEIQRTREALAIAEAAYSEVRDIIEPGMTEKEIAWMMEVKMREAGADGLAFPTICASGPNSALPHAIPEDRKVLVGEPLLFDWGVRLNGYCSDTSRTIFLGKPDDRFLKIQETVRKAQRIAIDAIRAGVSGREIDALARNYIDDKGYKGRFGHGLGHGTGLAVHEGPRLSPLSDSILETGMIVTVEPGIYIGDWGGVRIENQVVVRDDSAEVLNKLDVF
jgi:Xaa-Pro aminopeptidase